jgi:hypothetical protein
MEIKKTFIGKYFKNSVLYLFKSKIVFLIISLFEAYELLLTLINFEECFFYLDKNYFETKTFLKNILLQIAPYPYYDTFLKNSTGEGFDRNYFAIVIYVVLFILFYLYLFFGTKEEKQPNNSIKIFFHKICINFFDLILFRLTPLYGFDCLTREYSVYLPREIIKFLMFLFNLFYYAFFWLLLPHIFIILIMYVYGIISKL